MSENLSVYNFGGLRILKTGEPLIGVESRKVKALFISWPFQTDPNRAKFWRTCYGMIAHKDRLR
jgi:hypothetical protein